MLNGFASPGGEVILYSLAGVEFTEPFSDRLAVPTEFLLPALLSASTEGLDELRHVAASVCAFEFFSGVDEERFEFVRKFHRAAVWLRKSERYYTKG